MCDVDLFIIVLVGKKAHWLCNLLHSRMSALDLWIEIWSSKCNCFKIRIYCFSNEHAALKSMRKILVGSESRGQVVRYVYPWAVGSMS